MDDAEPPAPGTPAPLPPEPAEPRRRGLGPSFWIAIAFGFLCVVAGYALAKLGPRVLPPPAANPAAWQAGAAPVNRPPRQPSGPAPADPSALPGPP